MRAAPHRAVIFRHCARARAIVRPFHHGSEGLRVPACAATTAAAAEGPGPTQVLAALFTLQHCAHTCSRRPRSNPSKPPEQRTDSHSRSRRCAPAARRDRSGTGWKCELRRTIQGGQYIRSAVVIGTTNADSGEGKASKKDYTRGGILLEKQAA